MTCNQLCAVIQSDPHPSPIPFQIDYALETSSDDVSDFTRDEWSDLTWDEGYEPTTLLIRPSTSRLPRIPRDQHGSVVAEGIDGNRLEDYGDNRSYHNNLRRQRNTHGRRR